MKTITTVIICILMLAPMLSLASGDPIYNPRTGETVYLKEYSSGEIDVIAVSHNRGYTWKHPSASYTAPDYFSHDATVNDRNDNFPYYNLPVYSGLIKTK